MNPWQWQDKINYEIMMLDASLARIAILDDESQREKKSFFGHLHVAHSHILACCKQIRAAGDMAIDEFNNSEDKPSNIT